MRKRLTVNKDKQRLATSSNPGVPVGRFCFVGDMDPKCPFLNVLIGTDSQATLSPTMLK